MWYGHGAKVPHERLQKFQLVFEEWGQEGDPEKAGGPVYWRMQLTLPETVSLISIQNA